MDGIHHVAPRIGKGGQALGNGWKIPNLYLLLHIPCQISNFGPHKSSDVEAEESNHKDLVKKNAITTQKWSGGVFLKQLSN